MTRKQRDRPGADPERSQARARVPYAPPRLERYGGLSTRTEAKLSYMFDEGLLMTNDMS